MYKKYNPTLQFQTIVDASRTTGLSQYFLRNGCHAGAVPHIKSGNKYLINVPALIKWLDEKSENAMTAS